MSIRCARSRPHWYSYGSSAEGNVAVLRTVIEHGADVEAVS